MFLFHVGDAEDVDSDSTSRASKQVLPSILLNPHPQSYFSHAQYKVMVTAGANQAFTNIVLALLDETDEVVLFTPYYFNHL